MLQGLLLTAMSHDFWPSGLMHHAVLKMCRVSEVFEIYEVSWQCRIGNPLCRRPPWD